MDVLKGHIIRRSELWSERVVWKHQAEVEALDWTKEPQDMMVGVRFTYSADHFEGWRLGMESSLFGLQQSIWVSRSWWCGKFCSMLLEDSKKQDALVRVRCLVCFFFNIWKGLALKENWQIFGCSRYSEDPDENDGLDAIESMKLHCLWPAFRFGAFQDEAQLG